MCLSRDREVRPDGLRDTLIRGLARLEPPRGRSPERPQPLPHLYPPTHIEELGLESEAVRTDDSTWSFPSPPRRMNVVVGPPRVPAKHIADQTTLRRPCWENQFKMCG
jgi:hypothetical protein